MCYGWCQTNQSPNTGLTVQVPLERLNKKREKKKKTRKKTHKHQRACSHWPHLDTTVYVFMSSEPRFVYPVINCQKPPPSPPQACLAYSTRQKLEQLSRKTWVYERSETVSNGEGASLGHGHEGGSNLMPCASQQSGGAQWLSSTGSV